LRQPAGGQVDPAEYDYPDGPPGDRRDAIADLARQGRDIARRHPWLPAAMKGRPPLGPGSLRYVDYFLGLLAGTRLDTAAKMEIIGIINGFALMYGRMQAALDEERAHRHHRGAAASSAPPPWPRPPPPAATPTRRPSSQRQHRDRAPQMRSSTPVSSASSTAR